jgi:predicted 2-oxoglutarate/Fe(II)-dependent dioxygenase YbiX
MNPIITQQRVFSVEECNKIINCKSTTCYEGDEDTPARVNVPIDIMDDIEENKWITKRLEDVLSKINKRHYRFKDTEVYDNIGIKTYHPGEGFKWHGDGIDLRRLTIIVFLNNDYTGGDLRIFCGKEVVIKNNIGVLVAFPSWYFHQADKVLNGERKVLITWLVGEKFELYL